MGFFFLFILLFFFFSHRRRVIKPQAGAPRWFEALPSTPAAEPLGIDHPYIGVQGMALTGCPLPGRACAWDEQRCPHEPTGNKFKECTRDGFFSVWRWVWVPTTNWVCAPGCFLCVAPSYTHARNCFFGRNSQKLSPACQSAATLPPSIPREHLVLPFMLIKHFLCLGRMMQSIPNSSLLLFIIIQGISHIN